MTVPTPFSELTTMRVGGPPLELLAPATEAELVERTREVWASDQPWMFLGGGSNLVVADEGFDGTVIRVVTQGVRETRDAETGRILLEVQAGEAWDELVAYTVERGWAGIEALSGIPGSVGAAPVQNIGAYGQEVAQSLVSIEFLDFLTEERTTIPAADLGLDYRTSVMKQGREGLVLTVTLALTESGGGLSRPIAYPQLATALGVELGARVPLDQVRATVLALRASKGMVLDAADPDSVSSGSFFTNPLVGENFARTLPENAPRWPTWTEASAISVPLGEEPARPAAAPDYRVKLSAAWLIERAGIGRGFSLPGSNAAISSKHTLAIVNRGNASAEDIAELARFVQIRVFSEFGVRLYAEPVLVGLQL